MGSTLGLSTTWLSTHDNVVADAISRHKRLSDSDTYDFSALLTNHPSLQSCRRFQPSELLLSMLWGILLKRLSDNTDAKAIKTRESRLSNFLDFIKRNDLTATYLTTNPIVVDKIISRYIVYIISGFGCTTKFIEAKTVTEYLKEINKHYVANGLT